MQKYSWLFLSIWLLLFTGNVSAHTGVLPVDGFGFGFIHPFSGLDHFLVMSGLGLWASTQNRHFAHRLLAVFLLSMTAGAVLALFGIRCAYVETIILASVLLTGVLLAVNHRRMPTMPGLLLIVTVALMHGQAHGSEVPSASPAMAYIVGFILATAVLLGGGLLLGRLLQYYRSGAWLRIYGSLTGIAGAWLLYAA